MEENALLQPREYTTGKHELCFGFGILFIALALCNFIFFGGFNLGFAIAASLCILCCTGYLLWKGRKLTFYPCAILSLCLIIAASFGRSDDGFVKFVMLCFLGGGTCLGLCLLAGKQRRNPGSPASLWDVFFVIFRLGFGELSPAFRGLTAAFRRSGPAGQKSTAIVIGLVIAVPLLCVMIPLLMFADAAFEGLMDLLPEFSVAELFVTVLFGTLLGCLLYAMGTALIHYEDSTPREKKPGRGLACLTINTVLIAVCLVYAVYLLSQLAYFVGGFSGILPKGYTLAEYARRGFFEIAWLCAINLGIIGLSLALSRPKDPAPKSTRLLCLFMALVTLFLVATASAKMFLYIDSYGLSRLRVLTQVVLLFLGLTTGLVAVRLFVPKLPYMKTVVLAGLLLGALVSWVDVDSFVAKYNVDAYLAGDLETVDVSHLSVLGDGAVPHIYRLAHEAPDKAIAHQANAVLGYRWMHDPSDFRGWNYAFHVAGECIAISKQTDS